MTEVIIAMDQQGGIGYKGQLPWSIKEELQIFHEKTLGKYIVMGRVTAESIPKLYRRHIICMTKQKKLNTSLWLNTPKNIISNLLEITQFENWENQIMIAGGADIYHEAFKTSIKNTHQTDLVQKVHLSIINKTYNCDTFFDKSLLRNFVITEKTDYEKFTHYVLKRTVNGEGQYLELIDSILNSGNKKIGRNGQTLGIFKNDFTFNLLEGFPLLTTKKMFMRGIIEEFIFFINGRTDSTELSEKGVRIWEGNTSSEFIKNRGLEYAKGVMGPMYGYQWRFYNAEYRVDENGRPTQPQGGFDQLATVINLIKNDPNSRRILLTAYNPAQAEQGVLYPCHSITVQFYVFEDYLDMFCYNRSNDVFHGIPFNIASSALLLTLIAKLSNKIPRFFHMTMGDTHIYEEHIEKVQEQLNRIPYKFPNIKILNITTLNDLETLKAEDFILSDYQCHPSIKAWMVV
jgi:dihydrofolate reductase/thymidylate synthase